MWYCTYRQLRWYHKDVHDGCCTGGHFAFHWTVALSNHPECEQQAENNSVNNIGELELKHSPVAAGVRSCKHL